MAAVPVSDCRELARWGHDPLSLNCVFGCIFAACDAFFRQCSKARTEPGCQGKSCFEFLSQVNQSYQAGAVMVSAALT